MGEISQYISQSAYADKLVTPDIKAILPAARELALSRPMSHLGSADLFCAVILEDPELLHKLELKFKVNEEKLKRGLRNMVPTGYVPDPFDEMEEMKITPRVDAAFRLAAIGRQAITPHDLLRSLLRDDGHSELLGFLERLGVVPHCSPVKPGFKFKEAKRALNQLEIFLLGEDPNYYYERL